MAQNPHMEQYMEEQKQKFSISETFNKSKEYLETQMELAKLKAISRASRIIGSLIVDASRVLLLLLIVFFLSMALGFYLGEVLQSNALGFLATGGIFILIMLLIRVFASKIEVAFTNITIQKIMSKWGDDDEDDEDEEEQGPKEETITNEDHEDQDEQEPDEPLATDGAQDQEQARV